MFREHLELINEAVLEGSNHGIESFLETLDKDLKMDEIIEESGGVDAMMQQLFVENGLSVTEIDEDAEVIAEDQEVSETAELSETSEQVSEENLEESLNSKIDNILDDLKKEGLVD
jgi:hypothetical protein